MPYRREVRQQIGRRGLLLMLAGSAWVLIGAQILQTPAARFSAGSSDTSPVLDVMDSSLWGWMWVMFGASAVVTGFLRNRRPFLGRDDIGYNLIITPVFIWTMFFAWSWVAHLTSSGRFGQSDASYGLVVWALVSAVFLTISGWPEEPSYTRNELRETKARHRARHDREAS